MKENSLFKIIFTVIHSFFHNNNPEKERDVNYFPLSPCVIDEFLHDKGDSIPNKAYIPVTYLVKALRDSTCLNIAVSGSYGVGKSSVINTAENKLNGQLKFIRISFASLKGTTSNQASESRKSQGGSKETAPNQVSESHMSQSSSKEDGSLQNSESDNSQLISNSRLTRNKAVEYSILQQILYNDDTCTPKSRIQRIHKTSSLKAFGFSLFLLLFLTSLLFILNIYSIEDYFFRGQELSLCYSYIAMTVIILFFLFICYYISTHYLLNVHQIKYQDFEMKVKEDLSVFNSYMDEIVYFFESTKYRVVVFEDLDRFCNCTDIFNELKNLNVVLNNSKRIKAPIKFVYAVRDDFSDYIDRVKFFDLIIPVVPVINSLNSYDKLKEYLSEEDLEELDGRPLINLCDHLQDMRLLLNIVNEFNQYKVLIDKKTMNLKTLFGLMVIKNYLPEDFALMYNRKGVIAELLDGSISRRMEIKKDAENKCQKIQNSIAENGINQATKIFNLRKEYVEKAYELAGYNSYDSVIKINQNFYDNDTICKTDKLFDSFIKGNYSIQLKRMSYGEKVANGIKMSDIEEILGNIDERIKEIQFKGLEERLELEKQIVDTRNRYSSIPMSVSAIYSTDIDLLNRSLAQIKNEENRDLVKFLILNGFLDNQYQYYISYFYPNDLTWDDQVFVKDAGTRKTKQNLSEINNPRAVLNRFAPDDFENNECLLNVYLVKEVFDNNKHENIRIRIINNIKYNSNTEFIRDCYTCGLGISDTFFSQLLESFDYWTLIDKMDDANADIMREIYIRFCPLKKDITNKSFIIWLSNSFVFLLNRWNTISKNRILFLFRTCSPVFTSINLVGIPEWVCEDIINNTRYVINAHNFMEVMKHYGANKMYREAAYDTVLGLDNPLIEKVFLSNFNLLAARKSNSRYESEKSQLKLIKNKNLSISDVVRYLRNQANKIENSRSLDDDVLDNAFKNNLVKNTWNNIYYYTVEKHRRLPKHYFRDNSVKEKVNTTLSKKEEKELRKRLIFTNDIDMSYYKDLVPLFEIPFDDISGCILSNERMLYLISQKYIGLNIQNYETIKRDYPHMIGYFLISQIQDYLNNPNLYRVDSVVYNKIFIEIDTKKGRCDYIRAMREDDSLELSKQACLTVHGYIKSGLIRVIDLNVRNIINIIRFEQDEKDRVNLARMVVSTLPLKHADVKSILDAIGGQYRRINSPTNISRISYDYSSIRIVRHLKELDFITDYSVRGGVITILK